MMLRQLAVVFLVCLWAGSVCAQEFALVENQVSGNRRFPAGAVIAATGLPLGRRVTARDVEAGAKRLLETGLFAEVNYRYDPKTVNRVSGYAVTWQLEEAPVSAVVRLDFPGVDEQDLWQELKSANGLMDPQIPSNAYIQEYYGRNIEEALRKRNRTERIITKNEADLVTGKFFLVFRPLNLPKINGVRFDGNASVGANALQGALGGTAFLGAEYSEYDVRRLLDLNVKPLYEEIGRLTVRFPRVQLDSGNMVSVVIDEGAVWSLGKVEFSGESLPMAQMRKDANFAEGKVANWKEFLRSVDRSRAALLRDGYMGVKTTPVRSFHDDGSIVDVTVQVDKGKQFLFGRLTLVGLSAADRQLGQSQWSLPAGAPLDSRYIEDYMRGLVSSLSVPIKSISQQLIPRDGGNTIDVTISFR